MNHEEFELDPKLEKLLAEPEENLAGTAFVAKVMNRLPPPRVRQMRSLKRRAIAFGIAGAAACGTTWFSLQSLLPRLMPASGDTLTSLAPMAGAILLAACAMAAALYPAADIFGKALALKHE